VPCIVLILTQVKEVRYAFTQITWCFLLHISKPLIALHKDINQDAQLLKKSVCYWATLWRAGCRVPLSPNGILLAMAAEDLHCHQTIASGPYMT